MDDWHSRLDIPYRTWRKRRQMVLNASTVCHICGESGSDTVDHVIPLERGGTSMLSNLKPAHNRCNRGKYSGDTPKRGISPSKGVSASPESKPPLRRIKLP